MEREAYLVVGECGAYSDWRTWPIAVYSARAIAEQVRDEYEKRAQQLLDDAEALPMGERWELYNMDEDGHPMHERLVAFANEAMDGMGSAFRLNDELRFTVVPVSMRGPWRMR